MGLKQYQNAISVQMMEWDNSEHINKVAELFTELACVQGLQLNVWYVMVYTHTTPYYPNDLKTPCTLFYFICYNTN